MLEPSEDQYLVWSNEHRGWWRAGRCGYTPGLMDAGKYSRAQAIDICREAIPSAMYIGTISEIPVRASDVTEFLKGQIIPAAVMRGER
jgi:hypothetical protein